MEILLMRKVSTTHLTLRSDKIGNFPNDRLNIYKREPSKDINVSRNATAAYREVSGLPVADAVSEQC